MWGLAFKPNTDDVRFAPSIAIVKALLAEGAAIQAYDPEATEKERPILPNVSYCSDAYQAAEGADAVVLLTGREEFRTIDWNRLAGLVERPLIIDGRNALDASVLTNNGFQHFSVGRPRVFPTQGVSTLDETAVSVAV